eukprot:2187912-Karenia_brevis.AAC.1
MMNKLLDTDKKLFQNIFTSAFDLDLISLITKRVMQYDTSVTPETLQDIDWGEVRRCVSKLGPHF